MNIQDLREETITKITVSSGLVLIRLSGDYEIEIERGYIKKSGEIIKIPTHTVQTGGILRCCLGSIADEIEGSVIVPKQFTCIHCKREFIMSDTQESHIVPK